MRDSARGADADAGRPGTDPVVSSEPRLVRCVAGPRPERRLVRAGADRPSPRRCLGHDLAGPPPDHAGPTRTRDRHGPGAVRRFFVAVTGRCPRVRSAR